MKKLFITYSILSFLFSCSSDSNQSIKQGNQKNVPFVKGLKELKLEDNFFDKVVFLNGDKIKQAQSSIEWKKACDKKEPVWCYADPKTKQGILYNYFVFSDKRGIALNDKVLNRVDIEKIQSELESGAKSVKFNWFKESTIERSFIGNNYDLKFLNFWFLDESNSQSHVLVAVLDQKTNKLKIESVSTNNGYRIWLKK